MKRKRRPDHHPEVQKLFEAARRNTDAAPRKHHVVPNMYLGEWAVAGRIRVTDVDTKASWVTSPGKAGRITDFYSLKHEDVDQDDVPPLLFETLLSRLESEAVRPMRALAKSLPEGDWAQLTLDASDAIALGVFVAFQALRGRKFREGQAGFLTQTYRLQYERLTDPDALRAELEKRLGREPTDDELRRHHRMMTDLANGDVTLTPADPESVVQIGVMAQEIAPFLLQRNWRLFRSARTLITCDEPVVLLGGPGSPRTEVAGFASAAGIFMPVSPEALLVMFRPDLELSAEARLQRLTPHEAREINREIMANASRLAFEAPDSELGRTMTVPKWPSTTDVEEGYTTKNDPGARVVRFYKKTRWANCAPKPDWPVARWWTLAMPAWTGPRRTDFRL